MSQQAQRLVVGRGQGYPCELPVRLRILAHSATTLVLPYPAGALRTTEASHSSTRTLTSRDAG